MRCVILSDGDGVFTTDVGVLYRTSTRYAEMWLRWRTLSSADTR